MVRVHWAVVAGGGVWWAGQDQHDTVILPGLATDQLKSLVEAWYGRTSPSEYTKQSSVSEVLKQEESDSETDYINSLDNPDSGIDIEKDEFAEHCEKCNQWFVSKASLSSHIKSFHKKKNQNISVKCHRCNNSFETRSLLFIHIKKLHEDEIDFQCDQCDLTFSTGKKLKRHKKYEHSLIHKERTDVQCIRCNEFFETWTILINHVRNIHGTKTEFPCGQCYKTFKLGKQLKRHRISQHTFLCPPCDIFFCSDLQLKKHRIKNHSVQHDENQTEFEKIKQVDAALKKLQGDKPYLCGECGSRFSTEDGLERHINYQHRGVKTQCDQCDKSFSDKHKLKRHINMKHTGTLVFPCDYCEKKLIGKNSLKKHLFSHVDPTIQCHICPHKSRSNYALKRHIEVVHGEKKFYCNHCEAKFTVKGVFMRHVRIKHTSERNFPCPECEYKAKSKSNLEIHKYKHGEPSFQCKFCPTKCTNPTTIRLHEMTHTGEKPYACIECDYKCIQSYDLTKHYLKTHNKVIRNPHSYRTNI